MLRLIADVLWYDTLAFLILVPFASCFLKKVMAFRFTPPARWLVLIMFPWLIVVILLAKPGRQLCRNRQRYEWCYMLVQCVLAILMMIGLLLRLDEVAVCGITFSLWVWLLDVLLRGDDRRGERGDDHNDDKPLPDDPTPTGDAVERWLKSKSRRTIPS